MPDTLALAFAITWGRSKDGKHHRIEGSAPGWAMCDQWVERMPDGKYPPKPCVICFQRERDTLNRKLGQLTEVAQAAQAYRLVAPVGEVVTEQQQSAWCDLADALDALLGGGGTHA